MSQTLVGSTTTGPVWMESCLSKPYAFSPLPNSSCVKKDDNSSSFRRKNLSEMFNDCEMDSTMKTMTNDKRKRFIRRRQMAWVYVLRPLLPEYLVGQEQANRLHMCLWSHLFLRRRQRLQFIKKTLNIDPSFYQKEKKKMHQAQILFRNQEYKR